MRWSKKKKNLPSIPSTEKQSTDYLNCFHNMCLSMGLVKTVWYVRYCEKQNFKEDLQSTWPLAAVAQPITSIASHFKSVRGV